MPPLARHTGGSTLETIKRQYGGPFLGVFHENNGAIGPRASVWVREGAQVHPKTQLFGHIPNGTGKPTNEDQFGKLITNRTYIGSSKVPGECL